MANLIVSVTAFVALMATLCYAVPDLVFKNKDGADAEAQFGKSLFGDITEFASNDLSADLTAVDGITNGVLGNFKYFGNEENGISFENIKV